MNNVGAKSTHSGKKAKRKSLEGLKEQKDSWDKFLKDKLVREALNAGVPVIVAGDVNSRMVPISGYDMDKFGLERTDGIEREVEKDIAFSNALDSSNLILRQHATWTMEDTLAPFVSRTQIRRWIDTGIFPGEPGDLDRFLRSGDSFRYIKNFLRIKKKLNVLEHKKRFATYKMLTDGSGRYDPRRLPCHVDRVIVLGKDNSEDKFGMDNIFEMDKIPGMEFTEYDRFKQKGSDHCAVHATMRYTWSD